MQKRRFTNWWIHWEDLHWPNPDSLEAIRRKAEKYAEANITSAIIFGCHFRWDYMPFFTILHDYLATVAEELGKYNIELIDHHSVNLIHRYSSVEEMRRVMQHSGPHIPFSPSREAAATWEYNGKRLNDWRMIDVRSRDVLWFPQYAGEGFCHRNPEFAESYRDYAVKLVRDTGIKGLMADDAMYYAGFNACACPHCRQELKNRTGIDLPPIEDQSFWGNWENPAWKAWIDLRFDATYDFHKALRAALPEDFLLMSCGAASATGGAVNSASDARKFMGGCNYVNQEFSGNTPPYKHDPVTVNVPLSARLISASHHQAAAREKDARCYGSGYGFTEASANIIWAANKMLDADCHFSTLKARLGLPQSILRSLPEEEDVIKAAYTFEKEHPQLFSGSSVGQVGVYFSYETRNHTCFGMLDHGYYADFGGTLKALFRAGISAHTLFRFPESGKDYPLILVPSPASMKPEEIRALGNYAANGGKVLIYGPSAYPGCNNFWELPTKPVTEPEKFFPTVRDGVWAQHPAWMHETPIPDSDDPNCWMGVTGSIAYNPRRVDELAEELVEFCRSWGKPLPVSLVQQKGYFTAVFRGEDGTTLQMLAEDYDTDIDHHLDEIRYHRSRVNYMTKVEPIGVDRQVVLTADRAPQVYTPFNAQKTQVTLEGDTCTVVLPEKCPYAILHFPNA